MKVMFIALYDEWCLGLRQLSALLKREGHEVSMALVKSLPEMHGEEALNDPDGFHVPPASVSGADFKVLMDLVSKLSPDLIGLGFTSNFNGLAQHITARLRKVTDAPIAWGGIDPTANPDVSIEHADIVCVGEGDGAVVDLASRLEKGEPIHDIPNLWVRHEGEIVKNAVRPLIQDLETLPYSDFDPADKYWISDGVAHEAELHPESHLISSYPIMTTRGCPYACTFCCNSLLRDMYGNKGYVRTRPVENVIDELEQAIRRNPKIQYIEIWDDVFGVNMNWADEFADVYAERIGLPFWCYTYPSFIRPKLVKALKRAGIGFLVMGIQSGSQRVLDEIYNRKVPAHKVVEASKMIVDEGISLLVDLIDGYPFHTEQDNIDTLELMLQLPKGVILQEINPLSFYRGYPLMDIAKEQGHEVELVPGRNTALVEASPEIEFWRSILTLSQFKVIEDDQLRAMARDPYMREHPEIVKSLANALIEAFYVPNTRILREEAYQKTEQECARLRGSLHRLTSSRLVRWALGLREIVAGLRGRKNSEIDAIDGKILAEVQKERSARAITSATDRKRQTIQA